MANPIYNNKRWRQLREQVLRRDGYLCGYCGADGANTVDHIVPLKQDPSQAYNLDNLITACVSCNSGKRDRGGTFFATRRNPRPPISLFTPDQAKQVKSFFKKPEVS